MTDALDDNRAPKWPTVEGATRRIAVQIDGRAADNVAIDARDLIVLMLELGRVTAEGARQYEENVSQIAKYAALEGENHTLRTALEAFDPDKDFDGAILERYGKLRRAALAPEPTSGEATENRRLREALAAALQHLEKGRALWNGPCHQCAYVLRDALGMGEQGAVPTPASGGGGGGSTFGGPANNPIPALGVPLTYTMPHPPPPTQGEEERAKRETWICGNRCGCVGIPCRMAAALRQRADEATRAENEACAKIAEGYEQPKDYWTWGDKIAAAIRARMTQP